MPYELKPAERQFLELVSRAAFANPFGDERRALDIAISGLDEQASDAARLKAAIGRTHAFLRDLDRRGHAQLRSFEEPERRLVQTAYLFTVFHDVADRIDAFIQRQTQEPETALAAPFARDVFDRLAARGIALHEATRFLAMFFQLRRAYHFIDRALVGPSACMRHLRRALWNNVFTYDMHLYENHMWDRMEDFSTLLLGETGTGKGAAAAAIGRSGFIPYDERRGCFAESFMQTFRAINLSQFPESLLESELFGHRKGAFTGAVESHEGVLARSNPHGAIFLDEIGDASIPVQIKLLQVLQERTFSPVGSHDVRRFHGRVIAATNKSIDDLRRAKLFRDDFFYRLCSDVIEVPPLRQRIQETPTELDALLKIVVRRLLGSESPDAVTLVREVIDRDLDRHYPWPGNVRELEQCARRAILTNTYHGDVPALASGPRDALVAAVDAGSWTAQDLLSAYCALLYSRHGTYEEVSRRTALDRRTVKKYVTQFDL